MRIAIIGYGRMGHEVETIARERGHQVNLIIDHNNPHELSHQNLSQVDVAIEFTTPETAFMNVRSCLLADTPVVCGTTGWVNQLDEAKAIAVNSRVAFFYASNFSLGVNLFFELNKQLSKKLNGIGGYGVDIEEIHHIRKKDAPSGTAITLANIVSQELSTLSGWTLFPDKDECKIPIHAVREGDVPGTHSVSYNSEQDEIILIHRAKSRKGFAVGAVLAAEFCIGKKGFLTMDSFLGID